MLKSILDLNGVQKLEKRELQNVAGVFWVIHEDSLIEYYYV